MTQHKVTIRRESHPAIVEERTNDEGEVEGIIVEGLALPFEEQSRNGINYDAESIKAKAETMVGNSMLWNHDDSIMAFGHVEDVVVKTGEDAPDGDGMYYRSNIDPSEERLIRKVKRGDINSVSIQAFVDDEAHEDTNTVDIVEFLELSFVNIAGFPQTSTDMQASPHGMTELALAESLGVSEETSSEDDSRHSNKSEEDAESEQEDNMPEEDEQNQNQQNADGEEDAQEEETESLEEKVDDLLEQFESLTERVAALEADDGDDDDDEEDELDDDEEEDEEEASDEGDEEESSDDDDEDSEDDGSSKQNIGSDAENKKYNETFRNRVKNGVRKARRGESSDDD